MEIIEIRPEKGGNTLARFDVQLRGMRLYNLRLSNGHNGLRVFAPSAFGSPVVTFTADAAASLIALATKALGEIDRNDKRAA